MPGFGNIKLKYLVLDFNGTLAVDGKLLPGIRRRLVALSRSLEIVVLTANTHGSAARELKGIKCRLKILDGDNVRQQKARELGSINPATSVCIGNGNNDVSMLKIARVGIAVVGTEGAASQAVTVADIVVKDPSDALDLLLKPKRLKATLRL